MTIAKDNVFKTAVILSVTKREKDSYNLGYSHNFQTRGQINGRWSLKEKEIITAVYISPHYQLEDPADASSKCILKTSTEVQYYWEF